MGKGPAWAGERLDWSAGTAGEAGLAERAGAGAGAGYWAAGSAGVDTRAM